jgi:hypothetical protein
MKQVLTFEKFKELFIFEVTKLIKSDKLTKTKHGSVNYWLMGSMFSVQSVNIKIGIIMEKVVNAFAICSPKYCLSEKSKELVEGHQVDSLFDELNEFQPVFLNYKEQKSNFDLDTEKLDATIDKVTQVHSSLELTQDLPVKSSILITMAWSEEKVPHLKYKIKKARNSGIKIEFMSDYFSDLGVEVTEEEFFSFGKEIQKLLLVHQDQ